MKSETNDGGRLFAALAALADNLPGRDGSLLRRYVCRLQRPVLALDFEATRDGGIELQFSGYCRRIVRVSPAAASGVVAALGSWLPAPRRVGRSV